MINRLIVFFVTLTLAAVAIITQNSTSNSAIELFNPSSVAQVFSSGVEGDGHEPISDIAYYASGVKKEDIENFEFEINGRPIDIPASFYDRQSYDSQNKSSYSKGTIVRTGIPFIPDFFKNGENVLVAKIKIKGQREKKKRDELNFDSVRVLKGDGYLSGFLGQAAEKEKPDAALSKIFENEKKSEYEDLLSKDGDPLPLYFCAVPVQIVAIGIYDEDIPGDITRVWDITEGNARRVRDFYMASLTDYSYQLQNYEFTTLGYLAVGDIALFEKGSQLVQQGIISPIYERDGINTFPYSQGVRINVLEMMNKIKSGEAGGIINPDSLELIVVGDKLHRSDNNTDPHGLTFYQEGSFFVVAQQSGVGNSGSFVIPSHQTVMHELGHVLGLEHMPSGVINLMNDPTVPNGTNLEYFQLFGFHANLCGQSVGPAISFEVQTGKFGVNAFATDDYGMCMNGLFGLNLVGDEEVGESGTLEVGQICASKWGPDVWWNPEFYNSILGPSCERCYPPQIPYICGTGTCEEEPPPPTPPPYSATGCAVQPGAECASDDDCSGGSTCNLVTCQCQKKKVGFCGDGVEQEGEACEPPGSICDVWFQCTEDSGCMGGPVYCSDDCQCDWPTI